MTADNRAPRAEGEAVSLRRWLWLAYLKSAIVPLLVIELTFLAVFMISNAIIYQTNVGALRTAAQSYLDSVARLEGTNITTGLNGIAFRTDLFARQVSRALDGNPVPSAEERARYGVIDGHIYTRYDNGTTASFYPPSSEQGQDPSEIWKLSVLDSLMMDLEKTSPLVNSVYVNTARNYNRIYPYFDVMDQYPRNMNIVDYNFYYLADAKHNPTKVPVWTPAYVDPAGHGWMVSSIAPVWRGNRLEGVVGIDVTLETIIKRLNSLRLPWGSYAMLVDRSSRIIAMPPAGERDLGVVELTKHRYETGIASDTFKPDAFDLAKRHDTQALAKALEEKVSGQVSLNLNGAARTVSFSTAVGPHWHLVIVAPTANIYAAAEQVRTRSQFIGAVMVLGLLLFYAVFFALLYRRARSMSKQVAGPVEQIAVLVERIGGGNYDQEYAGSQVREIDQLGRNLVETGARLGEAHSKILAQEQVVSHALEHQQRLNEEQIRFAQVMSHELRTPLAIIDSTAQIIDHKADSLAPPDLRSRATRLRRAVGRMVELIDKLSSSAQMRRGSLPTEPANDVSAAMNEIVTRAGGESLENGAALLAGDIPPVSVANASVVTRVLAAVIENAVRYGGEGGAVRIETLVDDNRAEFCVIDNGPGITDDEHRRIGEPFYRGVASFGSHGAGLGLHIARQQIESIDGTLTISSGKKGAKVRIAVPVAPHA